MTEASLPVEGPVDQTFTDDQALLNWVQQQATTHQLKYLLAHAEDGVIWGKFEPDQLTTAHQVFSRFPALRLLTLQQCRIFGIRGEVLLWRTDPGWKSRFCSDPQDANRIIEELQLLWGTQGEEKDGFTLLTDGSQGLRHAVPVTGISFQRAEARNRNHRPVRLKVHHYVDYDEDGVAYISTSRLVDLIASSQQEN